MDLVNKHVLVVCSSNSVGNSLVKRFRSEGWRVSYSSRDTISDEAHYFLDVTSDESILAFCDNIKAGPRMDAMILLCGVLEGTSLEKKSYLDIDVDFEINAISQIKIVKSLLNHFSADGRVIFLNSISAFNGSYDVTYAASKAAIIGFIKSMAKHGPKTIRFNAIASGLIEDSSMASQFSAEDLDRHKSETPTGMHNESLKIADIIFNISGPSWINMNGQVIHVNGGRYV
jgi:NAD(P)-dependent dehydrogenase (short-subunit alcohol dehydrogenase family)